MSARERVTEIAVLRVLGFRRTHILSFILGEAVLMALLGGLLGIVLAKFLLIPAIVAGGSKTSLSVFLINFRVTWQVFLGAFLVSVGIGVIAGFVPAIRSSQLRIVDGLRQVV